MSGPLALVGGMEWRDGCTFDRELLEASGGDEVLVLPTAAAYEHPERAVETATAAYEGEQFERLAAPRGAPDDLTKLNGVGPQLEKKLNEAGIFHYWQLGAMQPADVAKLDSELKLNGRIERDGWIAQSRALIEAA